MNSNKILIFGGSGFIGTWLTRELIADNIKIIITPHIAGPSDYNRERSLEVLKTNLENFILKLPLINIVDKKLGF